MEVDTRTDSLWNAGSWHSLPVLGTQTRSTELGGEEKPLMEAVPECQVAFQREWLEAIKSKAVVRMVRLASWGFCSGFSEAKAR